MNTQAFSFVVDMHIERCTNPEEKLAHMIKTFGNFDTIRNVSKRAARIGLLLSSSKCVLELTDHDISKYHIEVCHEKTDLKVFVVVIPKEGLAGWGPANPSLGMKLTIKYYSTS